MLVLKENEVCPYSMNCPYNPGNTCHGARSDRQNTFTCEFVVNGRVQENGTERNQYDLTGKMKVITG